MLESLPSDLVPRETGKGISVEVLWQQESGREKIYRVGDRLLAFAGAVSVDSYGFYVYDAGSKQLLDFVTLSETEVESLPLQVSDETELRRPC